MKNIFWRLKRKKAIFDLLRQNFTLYENDNGVSRIAKRRIKGHDTAYCIP